MKRIILISFIIAMVISLTACISDAERKKGREDVAEGRKIIKEYVRETYGKKARASDLKPCYIDGKYDSTVPNLNKYASGFVKATVSANDTKFDILYNVHTDEVLTQENISAVKNSFCTYANEVLQTGSSFVCDMTLYSMKYEDYYVSGFIRPDIKTYQDLVSTGEYSIELTFRSVNSDFGNITEEQWKQLISPFSSERTESMVYMVFVNYKDEDGYKAQEDEHYYWSMEADTPYYATEEAAQYAKNIVYLDFKGKLQVLKGQ